MTEVITGVIEKFSETDGAIAGLQTEYGMLTITDTESKEQYDKVHDGRMMLVKMRTQGIDIIEAELKAPHLAFNKAVGEEANKRREQIKTIEAHLKSEEEKVDTIKEAARQEKIRKGQEKLNGRIQRMSTVGGCVDISVIAPLSDELFEIEWLKAEKIFGEKKIAEEAEHLKLAEEKKLQEEATAKLKADQDELKKKQEEMTAKQNELDTKQKAIDDAQKLADQKERQEAQKILASAELAKKTELDKLAEDEKKPDREKLLSYMEKIKAVPIPEITGELKRFLPQIQNTLDGMEKLIKYS